MAAKMPLIGKVAIVTGASKGLGSSIAKKLSEDGAALCLTGRSKKDLDEVASTCEALSPNKLKPLLIVGDITTEAVREDIFKQTIKRFHKIDILINNAGIMKLGTTEETNLTEFDFTFDINFRVPYDMCRKAIPHLTLTKGCIINMSSIVGVRPNKVVTPYCISKAAVDTLTTCLAAELGPKQVRVISVNPAAIDTALWKFEGMPDDAAKKFFEGLKFTHALHRNGKPEEVAQVVAFLASEAASFITGSRIMVDGGGLALPPNPS